MPINFLPSSPSRLCRSARRVIDSNSCDNSKRKHGKASLSRNYDEELLQHVQEARRQGVTGARGNLPHGGSPCRVPSPSLPYSKDFGTFDLTLYLAKDRRCVVLVEYEHRVFVNGRQIYVQDDSTVLDRLGRNAPQYQDYYDGAIQAKKMLRGIGSKKGGRSPAAQQKGRYNVSKSPRQEDGNMATRTPDRTADGNGRQDTLVREKSKMSFETELNELEAAFGKIIVRLCKTIFDVIGHETADSESTISDNDDTCQRERLQTTLDRLSDQFQSVVELSSSLKAHHDSAEAVQDMWMEGRLRSVGDKAEQQDTETIRIVESCTQNEKPSKPSRFYPKPHVLWEENQSLRKEVRSLEVELQQLEGLHKKVEDQFFEVESDHIDAKKQLAAASAENESLKKQLTLSQNGKGERVDPDVPSEGSASNLLGRFAKRLSGTARKTSPMKSGDSLSTCSSSNEEMSVNPEPNFTISRVRKDQDKVERSQGLDRHHNLRSEMKRLREVYKNMEDDMESLGEENRSLRLRLLKIERERKDMKGKIRDADGILEDRNRQIEKLDSVNSKLDGRCCLLASEKAALEVEAVRVNALYAETGSRLRTTERELLELEKTLKETETDKRHCYDRLDKLNQAHLGECNKTSRLVKEKASNEEQLIKLRRENGELKAELDKLRVENEANGAGRLRAEEEINRLELELQEAEESRAMLTAEVHHIRRDLEKSQTTCKTLEAEQAALKDKFNRVDAEANEIKSRSQELYLGNRMLEEETACLKDMNRQLQRENAEMQDTVSSLTDTNAGIRAKMRQWNRDNIGMEKKMKKLIQAKAELHGVIKQLNTVHSDIENRFEKLDSEYSDFEVRLTKGGNKSLSLDGKARQSASFEEEFQREFAQLKKQLQEDQEGCTATEEGTSCRRSGVRQHFKRRSSSKALAELKNGFAELENEILGKGKPQLKTSPQNANDVTFVSACSDLDSEDLGLWWDDSGNNAALTSATD